MSWEITVIYPNWKILTIYSDLSNQSAEILFEIYDRPQHGSDVPKFLGLGLVGIDELAVGPASSQILALQPRPYETEAVTGAITVEFVFIEGAEVPAGRRPYKFKEALKITNPAQLNGKHLGIIWNHTDFLEIKINGFDWPKPNEWSLLIPENE